MPLPFLAHQAAVLPLKRWFPSRFDGVALVVGSIAPDLSYAVMPWKRLYTHSWESLLWFSLPVGFLLSVHIHGKLPRICTHLDGWLGINWRAFARAEVPHRSYVSAALSVLVGAITHLVWDGFSHADPTYTQRWSPYPAPWLISHPAFTSHLDYVSLGSSILGAFYTIVFLRRARSGPRNTSSLIVDSRVRLHMQCALVGGVCIGVASGLTTYREGGIYSLLMQTCACAYATLAFASATPDPA